MTGGAGGSLHRDGRSGIQESADERSISKPKNGEEARDEKKIRASKERAVQVLSIEVIQ